MANIQSPDAPDASDSRSPAPNDIPINGNGNGNGTGHNKRKRAGANSVRGVANLTPQQLERKRANDREAQRAIRERTKQQIDRLNDKIRELESAQPYRDLQAVITQKEAVEAENVDIKRQLASFINVFRTFVPGAQGLEGRWYNLSSAIHGVSYSHPQTSPPLQNAMQVRTLNPTASSSNPKDPPQSLTTTLYHPSPTKHLLTCPTVLVRRPLLELVHIHIPIQHQVYNLERRGRHNQYTKHIHGTYIPTSPTHIVMNVWV